MVKIPTRLEELLPAAAMEKVMEVLHQPDISSTVRDALNRVGLKDANPLGQVQEAWQQARSWLESLAHETGGRAHGPTTINATGQLLSSEFDGVPMASSVAYGFAKSATVFQSREQLRAKAAKIGGDVFGRPCAWLNNPLAALQAMQMLPVSSDGIVLSRADGVRIPGFGDVRAMLTAGLRPLTEVGAANGASEEDWSQCLKSTQQLLLLVSPNSLDTQAAAAQRTAAIKAAKQCGTVVAELLIDGVVGQGLSGTYGFPNVSQRLQSGADLILLPLNFLIAGPPGLVVIGDEKWIRALTSAAENLGATTGGPQLAASSLAVQLGSLCDEVEAGVASQLLANPENLKNRARRLAVQLNDTSSILSAVEVERSCPLGASPWDRYRLSNWAVRVSPREQTKASAELMRQDLLQPTGENELPIAVATAIEGNDLIIDLRFVQPEDDHEIVIACVGDKRDA